MASDVLASGGTHRRDFSPVDDPSSSAYDVPMNSTRTRKLWYESDPTTIQVEDVKGDCLSEYTTALVRPGRTGLLALQAP